MPFLYQTNVTFVGGFREFNSLLFPFIVGASKRKTAAHEHINSHSAAPNISFFGVNSVEGFRGHVGQSANFSLFLVDFVLHPESSSKINDFEVQIGLPILIVSSLLNEHHIFQFYIPMNNF